MGWVPTKLDERKLAPDRAADVSPVKFTFLNLDPHDLHDPE